ncbi:hypothetical protein ACFVJS_03780 [Nocardioides sp. NPDC057772]|uniref:hypothetical protein n=1 Tax=Nocardioides sp. NPDC057772 TaxID=3346245 RepID=UPI0036721225
MGTRLERVVLEMDDRLSTPMALAASKTALLRRELDGLNGTSTRASASTSQLGRDVDKADSAFKRATPNIDLYSGRLRLVAEAGLGLGPSILPVIGALVPAASGLATGMAGAAAAAAVTALAFSGVGTALDALNQFQLQPTADNFLVLQQAMDELGPSGENLVRHLDSISGEIETLQRISGNNAFPGVTEGLDEILTLMPRAQSVAAEFATRIGDLAADGGASLAGDDWEEFFGFLETDAAPVFDQLARASGNVALGLANITVALAPLSRDFAGGMLEASRSFAGWTAESENFEDFIDYVREVGPQAVDFLDSLAASGVAVAQAVAPWGSTVLPAVTVLLDLFTAVAGSPIGPALTTATLAMLAFNKAATAGQAIMGRVGPAFGSARASIGQMRADLGTVASGWVLASSATDAESKKMAAATDRLKSNMATIGKGAGVLGAVGVAASGAAAGVGLQNTAMLGLAGTMAGPWGAAAGAGVGLILDFKAAQDAAAASAKEFSATLDAQSGALTDSSTSWIRDQFKPADLAALDEAGIGVNELTTAVLGGTDAYKKFADANNLQTTTNGIGWLTRDGADEASINMYKLATAVDDGQTAFELLGPEIDSTADSAGAAVSSLQELTAAQQAQTQASLAGIDAGTAYGGALAKAGKQAETSEQGFNKFTEAGRNNRTAMTQLVSAYNAQDQATKNSVKGYQDARREIAELGRGMGLTSGRIRELQAGLEKPAALRVNTAEAQAAIRAARDSYNGLPSEVRTHLRTAGVPTTNAQIDALVAKYKLTEKERRALVTLKDSASLGLGNIINLIRGIQDKSVTVTTTHVMRTVEQTAAINRERANGGFQENGRLAFADGGYGSDGRYYAREPMLITGGANILWGEKETGWEAYISGKPSERERNLQILSMAADRLGALVIPAAVGRITAYAAGGTTGNAGPRRSWEDGPVYTALWQSSRYTPKASLIAGMTEKQLIRLGKEFDNISLKALTRFGRSIERAISLKEKELDRSKETLDLWTNRRDQLQDSVRSSLTRDWQGSGNQDVWAVGAQEGTVAYANQQWQQQKSDAKELAKAIEQLRDKGAGDAFIAEILSSPDPLAAAKAFAAESKTSLMSSQKLFTDATRYTNAAAAAGGAIYSDEIRAATRQIQGIRDDIKDLNGLLKKQHKEAEETRDRNSASKSAARGSRSSKKR